MLYSLLLLAEKAHVYYLFLEVFFRKKFGLMARAAEKQRTRARAYRVAQKSKLLTQYNSLLFLSHPV